MQKKREPAPEAALRALQAQDPPNRGGGKRFAWTIQVAACRRRELCSHGRPVCTETSKLTVRRSTVEEVAMFIRDSAPRTDAGDEVLMAYLIGLDGLTKRPSN